MESGGITMATYNIVAAAELIEHAMRYYHEGWGYILNTSGQIWTQAAQDKRAKTDEQCRLYGQQWVGKHVIDCSGVWAKAMNECGSYMFHGSNTMWDKFCTAKGKLVKGARDDGQQLRPGTAIYTGTRDGDHNHVGMYIGDGQVLEAGGCQKGVCLTPITASKWKCWGEMKRVDYSGEQPEPTRPILRNGSQGPYVTLVQTKLIQLGYDLAPYGADGKFGNKTMTAVMAFQRDSGLPADGVVGPATYEALDAGKVQQYTVTVQHLSKSVAEGIIKTYGGTMAAEEV